MNHLTRAKSVFEMEIEELRGVLSRLDDNFNQAVELMSQALDRGNKIVIVGVGKSGNIGAKIVATLNSTGTPTVLLDSLNALHGDLGIVQDGAPPDGCWCRASWKGLACGITLIKWSPATSWSGASPPQTSI